MAVLLSFLRAKQKEDKGPSHQLPWAGCRGLSKRKGGVSWVVWWTSREQAAADSFVGAARAALGTRVPCHFHTDSGASCHTWPTRPVQGCPPTSSPSWHTRNTVTAHGGPPRGAGGFYLGHGRKKRISSIFSIYAKKKNKIQSGGNV